MRYSRLKTTAWRLEVLQCVGSQGQSPVEESPRRELVTTVTLWLTVIRVSVTMSERNFAKLTKQIERNV